MPTCQGAKRCGGVAWFTPQLIADTGVYASLPHAAMRFQVWTAVAYNIKGFFPWYYEPAKNPDLTDRDFFCYYADEMGRLEAAEKLLIAMERRRPALQLIRPVDSSVLVGSFVDRADPAWRFVVLANLDLDKKVSCTMAPLDGRTELVHIDTHGGHVRLEPLAREASIELAPGDGTIVFVGSSAQVKMLGSRYWNAPVVAAEGR